MKWFSICFIKWLCNSADVEQAGAWVQCFHCQFAHVSNAGFWFELTFQLFVIEVTVGQQHPQEHFHINVWKITISTLA